MKRNILTLAILLIASSTSTLLAQPVNPDSLTLERSVRMTLENHPLIQQALYGVDAAGARIGTSRTPYYPDILVDGIYERLDPVAKINLPELGAFELYPADNYDFHVELRQILYDFGRTGTSVTLAESEHKSAVDNVDLVKFNLAYQTIAVFKSMLILREEINVLDEQIDVLDAHLKASTDMIRAGTATDFDTLTTAVRTAVVRNQRIDVVHRLDDLGIALRRLTGWPADQPIGVKGSFVEEIMAVNPDSVTSAALRQRPELVLSIDEESSAATRARFASLGRRPFLALNMTSGFKNGYIPDLNDLEANIAAGVQLAIPIFDGHETRYRTAEADANLRAAEMHTADVRRQVLSDVDRAVVGVRTSLQKLNTSEIQVRQAEEALSMAQTRYEAGVATNLDVLDAQSALSDVKLIRLRALYDYTVSLSALDRATGKKPW